MKSIEIDTYFGDKPVHIRVIAAADGIYQVTVNKLYDGVIMEAADGWRVHLHPTTILQGDDVAVIIDLIEQNLN